MNNSFTNHTNDSIYKQNACFDQAIKRILRKDSISVIGEYKIGKTSFVISLIRELSTNKDYSNFLPIYINLMTCRTEDEILESILEVIFDDCPTIKDSFPNTDIYNCDVLDKLRILNRTIRYCNKNNIFLVLFIDQFDQLSVLKDLTDGFWSKLRGFAQEKSNLIIVTASRNEIKTLCHKGDIVGSQFWNTFSDVIFLSLMKDPLEIKNFLDSGFTLQDYEYLFKISGGHPCYLKIATRVYSSNKDSKSLDEITDLIFIELEEYFSTMIKLLEYDDLCKVNSFGLQYNYLKSLKYFLKDRDFTKQEYNNELNSFIKKGYIVKSNNVYMFFSNLFERFLREHFNHDKIINQKPEIYNGTDPYIFISYSHADSDIVFSQIEKLQKEGYRVWYDEGIPTSAKWKKNIEEKIDNCKKFIFFLSINSATSKEVNEEIERFKENKGKQTYINHFVMILLDDIKLCKTENTCDTVRFVISDCNGLRIPKDDDTYFDKLFNTLGTECKEGGKQNC
jgi:hypothetical protein